MSDNFVVKKRIDLSYLGEDWKDCYVEVSTFSWEDNDELLKIRQDAARTQKDPNADMTKENDRLTKMVRDHTISGKGFNGTKVVDITKENVTKLPMGVINRIITELQGDVVPN